MGRMGCFICASGGGAGMPLISSCNYNGQTDDENFTLFLQDGFAKCFLIMRSILAGQSGKVDQCVTIMVLRSILKIWLHLVINFNYS